MRGLEGRDSAAAEPDLIAKLDEKIAKLASE